jgi:hypothetical protein
MVREPYVSLLLTRRKTWELRGMATKLRGRIGLIRSGSGLIVGECEIVDCLGPLSLDRLLTTPFISGTERDEIGRDAKPPYVARDGRSKTFAWVIDNPVVYADPIPYRHPSGAIIFVDLTKSGVLECSEASPSARERQPRLF